ncbi:MAG: response regulator [Rhodospirillales bacterium]|nr:response regulator [Rhodospirillales bacterium]
MDKNKEQYQGAGILIVDDNPTNVKLLEMALEVEGFTNVTSTTDPREVLGMQEREKFDVILLDIQMPHMDGFEVMDQLRDTFLDDYMPVLVLTAQQDMETRLRALKCGARDFVTKPFDRAEVINRIYNMLEVRFLYNERGRQAEVLEAKVMERTQQLQDSRLELIRRLGRAGEYRDNETGMHVIRMSKSCRCLAIQAGLDEETAGQILHASPMHDLGKIGIPDNILLKPGKLEPDEWEIMKTHSEIGADIIGVHEFGIMKMAHAIALTHHEKWDGTGYPQGLKNVEIPIEGRISSICDVFDALTSERPYKKSWTVEKAVEFINENSGSHFDPDLVRHFNDALDEILVIRKEHADPE